MITEEEFRKAVLERLDRIAFLLSSRLVPVPASAPAPVPVSGIKCRDVFVHLSIRARKGCNRLNLDDDDPVEKLVAHTAAEFLKCKNFGESSLCGLRAVLSNKFGLKLVGDDPVCPEVAGKPALRVKSGTPFSLCEKFILLLLPSLGTRFSTRTVHKAGANSKFGRIISDRSVKDYKETDVFYEQLPHACTNLVWRGLLARLGKSTSGPILTEFGPTEAGLEQSRKLSGTFVEEKR